MNAWLWIPLSLLMAELLHQLTGGSRKFLYPLTLLAAYLLYSIGPLTIGGGT